MAEKKQCISCKSCKHFKNEQRLLNYWESTGFCTNDFKFNINEGRRVGVIDTENLRDRERVSGNPSHDFECLNDYHKLHPSRYLLQVNDNFGCIHHEPKSKKK